MLSVILPEIANKVTIGNLIAQAAEWYLESTKSADYRCDQAQVFETLDEISRLTVSRTSYWDYDHWWHYIHTARGMLYALMNQPDGAVECYQQALDEIDRMWSHTSGFGHDETYLYTWLEARLAAGYERRGDWERAEKYLERLLEKSKHGKPIRCTNAIRDVAAAGEDDNCWFGGIDFNNKDCCTKEILLRLISVYVAQEKLSRYRKAVDCYEQLEKNGVKLKKAMRTEYDGLRRLIDVASQ